MSDEAKEIDRLTKYHRHNAPLGDCTICALATMASRLLEERNKALAVIRGSKEPNSHHDTGLLAVGQTLIAREERIASLERELEETQKHVRECGQGKRSEF